ncbi:MAG: hypothetical protein A3D65_01315 [Candidatus Lloydbacteria bacterium RIFCSPHIGHO2_02_FULL_50_13]|uniref:Uncharacterized protein n=1 Tax=Candidatus Lloydbacteria bacterium RIFCSPHIGHO2_02_FULL_50_13 TaxID=1798661 RepID=A0A1G2D530_9BACT|nr:MAG: hypothetical protein A3D65_01315 [Candidatus Lloydbacteria bacterium RIFCSPHIGHO2_02_FULL_50_13]
MQQEEIRRLQEPLTIRLNKRPKNCNVVIARVVGTMPSDTSGMQELHLERPVRIRDTQGIMMLARYLEQDVRIGKLYTAGGRVYAFLPGGERFTRVVS